MQWLHPPKAAFWVQMLGLKELHGEMNTEKVYASYLLITVVL